MDSISEESELLRANSQIKLATIRLLAQADRVRRLECAGHDSEEASRLLGTMWDSLMAMHLHRRAIRQELDRGGFLNQADDAFIGRRTRRMERFLVRTLRRALWREARQSPIIERIEEIEPQSCQSVTRDPNH